MLGAVQASSSGAGLGNMQMSRLGAPIKKVMVEPVFPFVDGFADDGDDVYMSTGTETSTATMVTTGSRKRRAKVSFSSVSGADSAKKTRRTISAKEREDAYTQAKANLLRNWQKNKEVPAAKCLLDTGPTKEKGQ